MSKFANVHDAINHVRSLRAAAGDTLRGLTAEDIELGGKLYAGQIGQASVAAAPYANAKPAAPVKAAKPEASRVKVTPPKAKPVKAVAPPKAKAREVVMSVYPSGAGVLMTGLLPNRPSFIEGEGMLVLLSGLRSGTIDIEQIIEAVSGKVKGIAPETAQAISFLRENPLA